MFALLLLSRYLKIQLFEVQKRIIIFLWLRVAKYIRISLFLNTQFRILRLQRQETQLILPVLRVGVKFLDSP